MPINWKWKSYNIMKSLIIHGNMFLSASIHVHDMHILFWLKWRSMMLWLAQLSFSSQVASVLNICTNNTCSPNHRRDNHIHQYEMNNSWLRRFLCQLTHHWWVDNNATIIDKEIGFNRQIVNYIVCDSPGDEMMNKL